jgi:hypothetical protein
VLKDRLKAIVALVGVLIVGFFACIIEYLIVRPLDWLRNKLGI